MTETFRCERLSMAVSRGSCASLYVHHNRPHQKKGNIPRGIVWAQCRGCPIGKQHVQGKKPDVPLVPLSTPPPELRAWSQRTCTGCGSPIPISSWRKHACSLACAQRSVPSEVGVFMERYG